jgi:hypothetical protein
MGSKCLLCRARQKRHTIGTRLGELRVSNEENAEIMGHANLSVTSGYVKIPRKNLQEDVSKVKAV